MARNQKPVKIKRYKNTFNSTGAKKRAVGRVLLWTLFFAAIFAAAFFLAKPLTNFIKNAFDRARLPSSSVSEPQEPDAPPATDGEEPGTPPVIAQPHGAAIVNISQLIDLGAAANLARSLADAGVSEAVVVVKDAGGNIYYPSAVAMAAAGLSPTQLDLPSLIKAFSENGVTLTAKLYAYRDPIAASANRSAAVNYRGQEGVLWLDNAQDKGGKPWLSPYSAEAQQYILDMVAELTQMGFGHIVVDAVQYPAVYSLDYTGYGPAESTMTKEAALSQMVQKLAALEGEKGVRVSLEYPETALRGADLVSYIVSPMTYGERSLLIDLNLAVDAVPDTGALTELVNLAKQNGVELVGARITGGAYGSEAFAAQRQAALDAGFHWVLAG